ncbi:2-methylfumaryl-CoA hydratase [Halomicrobium sp. LC1Hm]|uniref:2-methylfumaryl-CoA hydratase n=1 Tax=Halomicrobium sp. LC1Hm TaxID=2610902 RepID=UPI0012983C1C|nr:2-methylfumaryl-CoA hydratase [Halomicrobium sp. LC1Hm]QGA83354.1 2-methylfumaryl-CoA hydratase [Halomicrobium sp. LC1Hm]
MSEWTDPDAFASALDRAETREKGHYFERFEVGETIEHEPGLVLDRPGTERWMGQTLNHDPAYWRTDAARERDFPEPPIHPDYLLACVMGATVEDLSEKGGYFLGRTDLQFHEPVLPGTEIRTRSTVESTAASNSRPDYGIVTWQTAGYDAETDAVLVSYERTNMVPRRTSTAADGGQVTDDEREADDEQTAGERVSDDSLPATLIAPEGPHFEDFRAALDRVGDDPDAAVAYRHERGRTMDDQLVAGLPLATLNTARQHHNRDAMADSPSGDIVAYGDVTRSVALAHARSDEATYRERAYHDESFHDFVTLGDTIYGFTRVLEADPDPGPPRAGEVAFEHVAFDQDRRPVYSGRRTALIDSRHQ